MRSKKFLLLLVAVLTAMIMTACGAQEETNSSETTDNQSSNNNVAEETVGETAGIAGHVVIDGSGTVYPLMAKIADEYMAHEQEDVTVEVSRSGTSAGFEKFLTENGTDFNDASREMKDEELAKANELGIEVKELKVALDGLTFVIHPENDWATELTDEQLINIFLADGGITKWSDIDPTFPDEAINTYGPNENHGTYEFFFDEVVDKQELVSTIHLEQEYPVLVNYISEDVYGIAFFGFGYYVNNKDKLQAVHVDFGNGPVEPSLSTIAEDGAYANFTRPVFTYLNVNHAKEKPQVLDYAIYVVNNINHFAGEVGFAPIPNAEVEDNLSFLEDLK